MPEHYLYRAIYTVIFKKKKLFQPKIKPRRLVIYALKITHIADNSKKNYQSKRSAFAVGNFMIAIL